MFKLKSQVIVETHRTFFVWLAVLYAVTMIGVVVFEREFSQIVAAVMVISSIFWVIGVGSTIWAAIRLWQEWKRAVKTDIRE